MNVRRGPIAGALLLALTPLALLRANDPNHVSGDFLGATPEVLLRELGAPRELAYNGDTAFWVYRALDRSELRFVLHHDVVVHVEGDSSLELEASPLPRVRDGKVYLDDGRIYALSEHPSLSTSGLYLGQPVREALDRLGPAEGWSAVANVSFTLDYGARGKLFLHRGRVMGFEGSSD